MKKLIEILKDEGWLDYKKGNQFTGSNEYTLNWNKKCTGDSTANGLTTVHEVDSFNNTNTFVIDENLEDMKQWIQEKMND